MGRRSFDHATAASTSVKTAPIPPARSFVDAASAASSFSSSGTGGLTTATTTGFSPRQPQPQPPQQQPRRISSASQKQSFEAATAQFAQSKLLEATLVEHRAAVDDTLGAYITAQICLQLQQQQQQQNLANDNNDDDERWEALVELIHDHCHVEWPDARSIIETIVERILASTVLIEGRLLPNDLLDEKERGTMSGPSVSPDPLHFPPLGSSTTATPKTGRVAMTKPGGKASAVARSSTAVERSAEADQVAAALFPPTTTRSRQSSMDESASRRSSSIDETLQVLPTAPPYTFQPAYYSIPPVVPMPYYDAYSHHHHHLQQQLQDYVYSTSELLLSMNAELSRDAAYTASVIANADVNVAQYLVESTMADVPICRDFLVHNACYRSDCPFSHVPSEHHTCVFWLKSYCAKGAACRFLHNFSDRLIQSLPQQQQRSSSQQQQQQQQYPNANPPLPLHPAAAANPDLRFPTEESSTSFATIAQQNYIPQQHFVEPPEQQPGTPKPTQPTNNINKKKIRSIPIPREIWNVTENRDAAMFTIENPLERYAAVQRQNPRDTVMDLHYQSLKTFPIVLETLLDGLLEQHGGIWIVTGTGHHVGRRTHQKSGGALEAAVMAYLTEHEYSFKRGKDKTGLGGALFVDGYNNVT
jgi:Smr domain